MLPIMLIAIGVSGALVKLAIPGLGWDFALLVGATLQALNINQYETMISLPRPTELLLIQF